MDSTLSLVRVFGRNQTERPVWHLMVLRERETASKALLAVSEVEGIQKDNISGRETSDLEKPLHSRQYGMENWKEPLNETIQNGTWRSTLLSLTCAIYNTVSIARTPTHV